MEDDQAREIQKVAENLRQMALLLPGSVRHRIINSLDHFDRALPLLNIDREMASFRAITGQEEAATALMHAVLLRDYPGADQFQLRSHQHKAAVLACITAIRNDIAPIMMQKYHLTFDFEKKRIDLKIPLANFGVENDQDLVLQFVEPLDVVHTKPNVDSGRLFERALESLATGSRFENVKLMVASQANARNTLLYASDSALPKSNATRDAIEVRRRSALAILVVAVMVLQSRSHQALVREAISAFLGVIGKLPKEDADRGMAGGAANKPRQ